MSHLLNPLLFVVLLCLSSLSAAAEPLRVSTAIPPLTWLAEKIGGRHVNANTFLDANQDHHTLDIKPSQIKRLGQADLYLKVGLPFETLLLDRTLSVHPKLKVIDTSKGIQQLYGTCHDEHHDHGTNADKTSGASAESAEKHTYDPHIWMNPLNAIEMARQIRDAFVTAMPSQAAEFRIAFAELETELKQADEQIMRWLSPVKGRSFYVYHPAFAYFAERYGLHERAVEVEGKAPSPRELAQLIKDAQKARVLFIQPQYDPTTMTMIADATGARVDTLDPLAYDYLNNLRQVAAQILAALQLEIMNE